MRRCKSIDYSPENSIPDSELLVRLLCTPLYYNKETQQVNPDAFDLRLLGADKSKGEEYVSLISKINCDDSTFESELLQLGYKIWDSKSNESNRYCGYGSFLCGIARGISDKIEIMPLNGPNERHRGLFYVKNDDEYYKGPLPKDDPKIVNMLSLLAEMLEDGLTIVEPE